MGKNISKTGRITRRTSKNTKLLSATVIAATAIVGVGLVGNLDSAEASTSYNWGKYSYQEVYKYKSNVESISGYGYSYPNGIAGSAYTFDENTGIYALKNTFSINSGMVPGSNPNGIFYTVSPDGKTLFSYSYTNWSVDGGQERFTSAIDPSSKQVNKTFITTVTAADNAYINNALNADGFWYVRGEMVNIAPTTPTLTVPLTQFEHGDKHFIGWNATDPNNDTLTYTLQVSYNNGAWENLYVGTEKTYEYIVPNNRGTSVKFRVIASDGQLTSTSAESTTKSIREVMYYWNKFNSHEKKQFEYVAKGNDIVTFSISQQHPVIVNGPVTWDEQGRINNIVNNISAHDLETRQLVKIGENVTAYLNQYLYTQFNMKYYDAIIYEVKNNGSTFSKGDFNETLQANHSAYQHGIRNADGYWYERGQRVLSEDVTPPIIELTEQTNYASTSTVTVKTHDLGTVQTVKWVKGEQNIAYFVSNGTTIGNGQSTPSTFSVSENGIYTVYAVDNKGNAGVQTIEVKNANTPPVIRSFTKTKAFDVVDASTNASFVISVSDREQTNLTASVQYNGKTAMANLSSTNKIELNGANYSKGLHDSSIVATVNDGIVNSSPVSIDGHIIIKVDDAVDYVADLNGHTSSADSYTKAQHQAFLTAYEAVRTYESGRTQAQYDTAKQAIADLIAITGGVETATTNQWNERLAVVLTTVALEKAESSLAVGDMNVAKSLYDVLALSSNKDLLKNRFAELMQYHVASEILVPMENEVSRHKADSTSELNTTIITIANFNLAKVEIAKTNNTTEVNYKTLLNQRLNDLRAYYLNNKGTLTPEDLVEGGENVDPALPSGYYDEFKDAFQPVATNLQPLINYVNGLVGFLRNVDEASKINYHNVVAGLPKNTGIDFNRLQKVSDAVDAIYDFRSVFKENQVTFNTIEVLISNIDLGLLTTKPYMENIGVAMKEVIEYNDVALDAEHDVTEKQEAEAALNPLWENSKFKTDMVEYLTNGIPAILIGNNPYEYIVDSVVTIKGSVTDTNHSSHEVTVTLGIDTQTITTNDGEFSVTFNRAEGVYINDALTINVFDGLTNKAVTVKNKPVISVSKPVIFTDMAKALETDLAATITTFTEAQLTELLAIFNKTISADRTISPSALNALYEQAERLSGQPNGVLEQYIHDYIQSNLLQWIFDNHQIATTEDYSLAGVLKDGSPIVTNENIADLTDLITEYKANSTPANTPTVNDYIVWLEMLASLYSLDSVMADIYTLDVVADVEVKITQAQTIINTIPSWSNTLTDNYGDKLADTKDYKNALEAVIKAETSYEQTDLDAAKTKVITVDNAAANQKLINRLTNLEKIVNADITLTKAETTLDEADIANAKALIDPLLNDASLTAHDIKIQEMRDRLAAINKITDAKDAVKKAEDTFAIGDLAQAQVDKNAALNLVDQLPTSQVKDDLKQRLSALQKAIDEAVAEKAVEQAEISFGQTDHDNAKVLVDALDAGATQTVLLERLAEVQKVINAVKAIKQAELTASDADILVAQNAINELAAGTKKTELQNRLDLVKKYSQAVKAVVAAEQNLTQIDHDNAKVLVDALTNGQAKTTLLDRLAEVQKTIDAIGAVEKAEGTKNSVDVIDAQNKIDVLQPGPNKDELQNRLNEVSKYIQAEKAVTDAEVSLKQIDKDKAEILVNELAAGPDKDALLDRLNNLQKLIDQKSAEEKAEDKVEKAEDTWDKNDLVDAEKDVEQLDDGQKKDDLNDRLNHLEKIIDLYEKTLAAVQKAETSKQQVDVTTAQTLLNDLVTLVGATNEKTEVLQVRIDEVNRYISAEKAVTLAESSKYQRHVDEAQNLIDKLKVGPDKEYLQERLDKIKVELEGKESDILDRIVNGGEPPVTAQELADYTNETVYEELLDAYIKDMQEIADVTGTLTKDDVVGVIRLLNAIEIAKREMTDVTITAYQTELANTKIAIKSKYPEPQIMFATAAYLADNSQKVDFVQALAALLNRDITDVMNEVEELLAGHEESKAGNYSVQYVDENGVIIHSQQYQAEYGVIDFKAVAPEGYEVISEPVHTFELSKENNDYIISFIVRQLEEQTTTEDTAEIEVSGTYTVKYVTNENVVIDEDVFDNVKLEQISVAARLLEGYELIDDAVKLIELTEEDPTAEVIFIVQAIQFVPPTITPEPEPKLESEQTTTNDSANVEVEQIISDTVGEETAFVRSLLVASLNDLRFSFTQVTTLTAVSHEQYLYEAAQALLMVKAYVVNPSQANLDTAMNFVTRNLYDGAYKSHLLTLLNSNSANIGEDGKPDLTPVYPYEPPVEPTEPIIPPTVVEPPVEPTEPVTPPIEPTKPVTPPTEIGPEYPNYVYPTTPDVKVPEEGTIASEEKVNDVVMDEDGNYKWVVDNPVNTNFTLTAPDMNISITFDKETIDNADKLEIIWKHLGNEHYQLIIYADGEEVSRFDAKIDLKKERDFAYMLRKVEDSYKALPYNYKDGNFNFAITRTGVFFFTKEQKTFKDISGFVDSKSAIEELASRHIVYGVAKDKYNPSGKITRGQLAAMLTRALGLEASDKETPFKDTKGKWYEKEVQALYEAGIIKGTSATSYSPEKYVTRQQAALMFDRIIQLSDKNNGFFTTANQSNNNTFTKLPTFADSNIIADNARLAVAKLESLGIIKGFPDGKFKPNSSLTRSQMAKMMTGVLKFTGDM